MFCKFNFAIMNNLDIEDLLMTTETIEFFTSFFGWASVINIAILLWWALFMFFAKDFVYKTHTKWFKISKKTFNAIHYSGIAFYKLTIFVFNLVPYIVLKIMY